MPHGPNSTPCKVLPRQPRPVSPIEITATSNINGLFSVDNTGGVPEIAYVSGGSNTTTLSCTRPQILVDSTDFYIYLPAGEYAAMQMTIYQPDGSYCTKRGANVVVERSKITAIGASNLEFEGSGTSDLLSGVFSVSATQTVRFAKGNLVATTPVGFIPNDSHTTWYFHQNQYDMVGDTNAANRTCDLFGWSTASTYYGLTTWSNDSYYSGSFVDWGKVFGTDSPWRTLTGNEYTGEWYYLLETRNTVTTNMASGARYAQVRLSDGSRIIPGMLLFPDIFAWPLDSEAAPTTVNSCIGGSWNNAPLYTIAQFASLEAAGCVFLPAAGYRIGEQPGAVCSGGCYWSSTTFGGAGTSASFLVFYYSYVYPYYGGPRHMGQSVRLVQNNR